jgi:hypothetical protein
MTDVNPNPLDAFKIGQRVQLHPDTHTAVGDRRGEAVIVGEDSNARLMINRGSWMTFPVLFA